MRHRHAAAHVAIDFSNGNVHEEEEEKETELAEAAAANNGRYISPQEYLDTVYTKFLLRVSERPRKSDLLHDMFVVQLTTENEYGQVTDVELVRWMTSTHVLKEVLMHNYQHGNLPVYRSDGCARIHDHDVRGVPLVGFPDKDVRMVADLVWETLKQYPERYALYNDDGLSIRGGGGDNDEKKGEAEEEENHAIIITSPTDGDDDEAGAPKKPN